MYVAGSHTDQDWYDGFTKVPTWGDLRKSVRYQEAEKALKQNPQVNHVVGHSLGGSVSLELQKTTLINWKVVGLMGHLLRLFHSKGMSNDTDIMLTLFLYLIDPRILVLN